MANDHSLKRIFSSPSSKKYPTVGKFLPSLSSQKPVFSAPPVQVPSQTDQQDSEENLNLLDDLVTKTLLSRPSAQSTPSSTPAPVAPVSGRAKENLANLNSSEQPLESTAAVEAPLTQAETAENLNTPEINELSKELQEVSKETKEQREQAEIAQKQKEINNLVANVSTPVAVSDKPVVVLPITEKSKEEAKFKSTKYSVRWLLEWCKKVAKIFSGAVVYKEEVEY